MYIPEKKKNNLFYLSIYSVKLVKNGRTKDLRKHFSWNRF